jgi:uncharacterized membrane protein YeaQ/YmgE (transglycosylase-associated protein family)
MIGQIVIGFIAGLLARVAMPGPARGRILTPVLIGISGSLVGGFITQNLLGATFGAVLLLAIYRLSKTQFSPASKELSSRYRAMREWLGLGKDGGKTGLDVLQVIAAASIPVMVVVVGALFNVAQSRSQQSVEEQRARSQQAVED